MQSQSKHDTNADVVGNLPCPTNNTNQYKVQQIVVNFCPERNKDCLLPQPQQTKQEEERKTKHQWWRWQGHNSKGSYGNTAGFCPKKYSVLQKESARFEPNTVPSTFTHDPPSSILRTLCGRHYYFPALQMRNWALGRSSHCQSHTAEGRILTQAMLRQEAIHTMSH